MEKHVISSNVNITLISETKLSSSIPIAQFEREAYTENMLDGNAKGRRYIFLYLGTHTFYAAE